MSTGTPPERDTIVLGVDGGGTQCVAWLGRVGAESKRQAIEIVGRGQAGAANPQAVGWDQALGQVAQALELARQQACLDDTPIDSACLCLAGVAREADRQRIEDWNAREHIARRVRFAHDGEAVVAAAAAMQAGVGVREEDVDGEPDGGQGRNAETPREISDEGEGGKEAAETLDEFRYGEGEGAAETLHEFRYVNEARVPPVRIALIAGTGSLAWGETPAGRTARAGGWGHLLGDEGSGYALGLALLRLACRVADGRLPAPELLDAVLQRLQLDSPAALIDWTYAAMSSKTRIAGLAPLALELATRFAVMDRCVDQAAGELAEQFSAVVRQLDVAPAEIELVLSGGLLVSHDGYARRVVEHLEKQHRAPGRILSITAPVLGAVYLAYQRAVE